jgi:hypothetical protein
VSSRSCLPALLRGDCLEPEPRLAEERGAKNLLKRLGVTGGGLRGLREARRVSSFGTAAFSWPAAMFMGSLWCCGWRHGEYD